MKDTLKKVLKYVLSLSLAAALLWFSFRDVDWNEFYSGLKDCRWEWIVLSMVAGAFAFWLRAVRWRQLLQPLDNTITRTTAFNAVNIGNLSNFVFPRLGEFVRCGVIVRHSKSSASYKKVLGTVVLERAWELLVMLLLLAVLVIFGFERFGNFFVQHIWEPMSQKFDTGLLWMLLAVLVIGVSMIALFWRLRKASGLCAKIWGVFKGIGQGFSTCFRMDRKWLFFAYTAFIWVTYWFMAYAIAKSVPSLGHLDLIDALFLSLVGGLGFFVPVPGGIGAYHFIISMTLSTMYGAPSEIGLLYATLSHSSQAITQIIFGLGSYAYEALLDKNSSM